MSEEKLNIYQKLAKIRKNVAVLSKNKSGYGYKYVSEDEILARVTGMMDKLELSLIPSIVPGTTVIAPYHYTETKVQKDGKTYEKQTNEILVSGEMLYTWVDNKNPAQKVEVPWTFVGQQADASQAFGSGLSYSSRYFLLKYFNSATTEDDPDNWRSRQQEAAKSEEREIAREITGWIHAHVTAYVQQNPDKRDAVIAAIKSIAVDKSGKSTADYMKIEDPAVASALKKKLNDEFFHEKENEDA